MLWNKDYSLQLSIWSVRIFFILWLIFLLGGYFITDIYVTYNVIKEVFYVILITLYCCLGVAIFLLNELHKLLINIQLGKVFISDNVVCLRKISWFCIAVGVITLLASIGYIPFILVAITFIFIALIVRVVKNVIEEAIMIKEENDFTI